MILLKCFLVSFFSFAVLDAIWLGYVMKDFNMRHLSEIGRIENGQFQINFAAALVVYILMALAITFFVHEKTITASYLYAFGIGALLGLIVYGIYDFTNFAILKNYPLAFVAADVLWGTFVFGAVAVIAKKFV